MLLAVIELKDVILLVIGPCMTALLGSGIWGYLQWKGKQSAVNNKLKAEAFAKRAEGEVSIAKQALEYAQRLEKQIIRLESHLDLAQVGLKTVLEEKSQREKEFEKLKEENLRLQKMFVEVQQNYNTMQDENGKLRERCRVLESKLAELEQREAALEEEAEHKPKPRENTTNEDQEK